MSLKKMFETDATVELNGVEFPIVDDSGRPSGMFVVLARAGGANKAFEVEKEKAVRNWRAKNGKNAQPSDDDQIQLMIPVFAKTIIKSWFTELSPNSRDDVISFDDGDNRSWSVANAEEFLRLLPKVRLIELMETAADFRLYRASLEEVKGNSSAS